MESFAKYIGENPAYYGLKKASKAVGFQNPLKKYLRKSVMGLHDKSAAVAEFGKKSNEMKDGTLIHPLYVEMQK